MSRDTDKGKLVAILAGMDYEGGGMMRWSPSGEPTDRAFTVADTIQRAGFVRPNEPVHITEEEFTEKVLSNFHAPDAMHSSWWINPADMMRDFLEEYDIVKKN